MTCSRRKNGMWKRGIEPYGRRSTGVTSFRPLMSNPSFAAYRCLRAVGHWRRRTQWARRAIRVRIAWINCGSSDGSSGRGRRVRRPARPVSNEGSLREFAREQLAEADRDALDRRHADYFLSLAMRAKPGSFPDPSSRIGCIAWRPSSTIFEPSLRWARRNDPDLGLRIAASLPRFWDIRSYWKEGCFG